MTYSAVAAVPKFCSIRRDRGIRRLSRWHFNRPRTASAGTVFITDAAARDYDLTGSSVTALPTLAPFYAAIGAVSRNGAGGWKVTTGPTSQSSASANFT